MMKQTRKMLLLLALLIPAGAMAQTRASDSTPKEPQGATYTLSDGSTVTKTGETINSETQYYNAVITAVSTVLTQPSMPAAVRLSSI